MFLITAVIDSLNYSKKTFNDYQSLEDEIDRTPSTETSKASDYIENVG